MKVLERILYWLDHKYRALHILNHSYYRFRMFEQEPQQTTEDWISKYYNRHLRPNALDKPSKRIKKIQIEIIFQLNFITTYLGYENYPYRRHIKVWKQWKKYKNKHNVKISEPPTIFFKDFEKIIATARSSKIAQILKEQEDKTIIRDYSTDEAERITKTINNIFT